MYLIYSLALTLAAVVSLPYFLVQGWRKHKYLSSFRARLGNAPSEVHSQGDAIWLHAVSVGEVLACQRLATAVKDRFPERRLLISTTTETGFRMARERLRADGFFYCPFDFAFAVRRVLARVRPALLVIAETELWPNLLKETARAGAGVAVVNARVSDRSFPRYLRFRFFFRRVLADVSVMLAQSEEDARRLRAMGAAPGRISVAGNLKYDQPEAAPLVPWLDAQVREWMAAGGVVAGSTAAGEEETILDAFRQLLVRHPSLRLVVAPRRPERFTEVAEMTARAGFTFARRSQLQPATGPGDAQVLLLDTIGELSSFYRYAAVAFVGGSLVPHGGQNVLEAAQFARPVVVGPFTSNFRDITGDFRRAGALRQVASAAELLPVLAELLENQAVAQAMGEAAARLLRENRGATGRVVAALETLLQEQPESALAREG